MSSRVRPASATAARQASIVSDSGSTVTRRPMADRHAREHRAVLEALVAGRGPGRGPGRLGHPVDRVERAGRLEQRQPHVVVLLEGDLHLLAHGHVVGVAAHDVGGEAHRRVPGKGHVGDHVGRLEARGHWWRLTVKPMTVARPDTSVGDDFRLRQGRADRHGRVNQLAAVVAALDPQAPIRARGPEPLVERGEPGEGAHSARRA